MSGSSSLTGLDLSQIPVEAPPPGETSNFVDPPTLVPAAIALAAIFIPLQLFCVALRIYIGVASHRQVRWDDLYTVWAMGLNIGFISLSLYSWHFARNMWDIPLSFITEASSKATFAQQFLMGPVLFFSKTTMLALYWRIFKPNRRFRIQLFIVLAFAFVTLLASIPVYLAICLPAPGTDWIAASQKCGPSSYYAPIQGPCSLVVDLAIIYLPVPIIRKLNMSAKKKLGVFLIFTTGVLAVVASTVSLVYRVQLFQAYNAQRAGYICFLCTFVESSVSTICACLPTFAALTPENSSLQSTALGRMISALASLRSRFSSGTTSKEASGYTASPKRKASTGTYIELGENVEGGKSSLATTRDNFERRNVH